MPSAQPKSTPQSSDISRHLNAVLKYALTGINQYFLHARMLKHSGAMKLADRAYKHSLDTMRHADRLVERVLAIGGAPNLQELAKLQIGGTPEEILRGDLALQQQAFAALDAAIASCEASGDSASLTLLESVRKNLNEYGEFLQQQLKEQTYA